MEIGAFVESDGSEVGGASIDGTAHGLVGLLHVSGGELPDDAEAGSTLDEGQDTVALGGDDDGVAFPMAELAALLDDSRSIPDVTLADESAAGLWAAARFASELGDDALALPELATPAPVEAQISVDGLGAHGGSPLETSAPDDLAGTPFASDGTGDVRPGLRAVVEIPA